MNKKRILIILLLIINVFLIFAKTTIDKKALNSNLEYENKNVEIHDNDLHINELKENIEKASKENELIEKEYKVWIHQNEILTDILQ